MHRATSTAVSNASTREQPSRPRFEHADDDTDEEEDRVRRARGGDQLVEEISGMDFVGSHTEKARPAMVIPLIKKNNWRGVEEADAGGIGAESVATKPAYLPTEGQPATKKRSADGDLDPLPAGPKAGLQYGLQIMKKRKIVVADLTTSGTAITATTTTTETTTIETETTVPPPLEPMSVDDEARAAVINDALGNTASTRTAIASLPLIAQNAVPGLDALEDVVEKYRHDVALRPAESTLDDYARVPIEEFGMALLRGMGWEQGRAVGKNPDGLTEPITLKSRPQLLGLGATPAPVLEVKQKKYIRPGEKRKKDPLADELAVRPPRRDEEDAPRDAKRDERDAPLRSGDRVTASAGKHTGSHGMIVEIKKRDSGTVAKVRLDGSDRDDFARIWIDELVRFRPSSKQHSRSTGSSPRRSSSSSTSSWLRPHVRVRIVSRSLGSKHHNRKGVIHDVQSPTVCTVRLDGDRSLLDDVAARHLETVVPAVDRSVLVVRVPRGMEGEGIRAGDTGRVKERDPDNGVVTVQMDEGLQYIEFGFDDVAEFVE
ncbi:hypothetical protein HKX48_008586 [Thoreauomyces humboldtii]|nr:hypothetical protein HKX48_008586 [Thoreauomyces humboldtii]